MSGDHTEAPAGPAPIVVGLDGSKGGRRALTWCIPVAKRLGAEVIAVLALRPVGEFVITLPPFPVGTVDAVKRSLEEDWVAPLADAGLAYRTVVLEADPASALRQVAASEGAQLIVVGSDGHGGVAERFLGSVTYRLAHEAPVPLVIVPPETGGASRSSPPER